MDKYFLKFDPFDELKKMPSSKKFYLLRMMVKNAKWWSKSNLPLFLTEKCFPFIKGFKKCNF